MKVLVATSELQGQRSSDFSFVPDGEIVLLDFVCDTGARQIDGSCGCERSFSGVETHKAITTAKVVEMDLTDDQVAELDGFGLATLRLARRFRVGRIVERRGAKVQIRRPTLA